MTGFARELAHSVRQLWHTPGFTWPTIGALALGIGATTSVFSIFSAMLLRPMGFREPAGIVGLWESDPEHGQSRVEVNYRDLTEWRTATREIEEATLVSSVNLDFTLFAGVEPDHVEGVTVSGSFFRAAGATPFAGRLLTDDDDRPGVPVRAVISYGVWRSRFGSDPGVVGRQIRLDSGSVVIVGIARPEFNFPKGAAVWVALRPTWPDVEKNADLRVFRGIARLRQGVSVEEARARLNAVSQQMQRLRKEAGDHHGVTVTPILDEIYGPARTAIRILMAAVFFVLLIACANAANLVLARSVGRSREIAIRTALGAGRRRMVALLLGESAILGAVAGITGMLLAVGTTTVIAHLAPADVPRIEDASVDLPVLGFGLILTCGTVMLFGLAPAVMTSDRDPNQAIKRSGPRATGSVSQSKFRRILIVAEVAFASLLLAGAGLLVRSFSQVAAVDPGFQANHILTFRITTEKPDQESRRAVYGQVLERLRALPGVESAAAVLIRPLSGAVGWDTVYAAEGQTEAERQANPNGNYEAISTEYFKTMGIRLMAGRDFTSSDNHGAPQVMILNEATAKRHWREGNAVGKRIRLGDGPKSTWSAVVGVVSDVRYREWERAQPDFYVPYLQRAQHRSDFVLKTHGNPLLLAEAVRRVVLSVDKNQPISDVTTMSGLVDAAIALPRFNSVVLGGLAVCAILLAGLGIYSALSYMVGQSGMEIGLRMAVGATPLEVARLIAGRGMSLVIVGLVIGLAGAMTLSPVLAALLFGISAFDPVTYLAACSVLLLIAFAACAEPALRAANIDPIHTLRSE